jgi:hypothetical protein
MIALQIRSMYNSLKCEEGCEVVYQPCDKVLETNLLERITRMAHWKDVLDRNPINHPQHRHTVPKCEDMLCKGVNKLQKDFIATNGNMGRLKTHLLWEPVPGKKYRIQVSSYPSNVNQGNDSEEEDSD